MNIFLVLSFESQIYVGGIIGDSGIITTILYRYIPWSSFLCTRIDDARRALSNSEIRVNNVV